MQPDTAQGHVSPILEPMATSSAFAASSSKSSSNKSISKASAESGALKEEAAVAAAIIESAVLDGSTEQAWPNDPLARGRMKGHAKGILHNKGKGPNQQQRFGYNDRAPQPSTILMEGTVSTQPQQSSDEESTRPLSTIEEDDSDEFDTGGNA